MGVWGPTARGSSLQRTAQQPRVHRHTPSICPSWRGGAASQLLLLETCPCPGRATGDPRELCHPELPLWDLKGRLGITQPGTARAGPARSPALLLTAWPVPSAQTIPSFYDPPGHGAGHSSSGHKLIRLCIPAAP